MLEVHSKPDGFTVFDTDAAEPIIRFATRAEAEALIVALQIQDLHGQLARWTPERVPAAR